MGLPHELLPFAENFYRRFPEEFVALGMPGLEQIYDLRADGTRSRSICETPTEKTIAITVHRWQIPPAPVPPPMQYNQPYQPFGAWQYPMYSSPPPVESSQYMRHCDTAWPSPGAPVGLGISPPTQHNTTSQQHPVKDTSAVESQIARLESTIAMLKPQIEAVALSNHAAQPNLALQIPKRNLGTPGSATDNVEHLSPGLSPDSPLRNRRGVKQLQITTPGKEQSPANTAQVKQDIPPRKEADTNPVGTKREAPSRIQPVRMVPSAMDPESPRSPGKFSVWK